MRSHSQAGWGVGMVALLAATSPSVTAEARTCTTGAECPLGFQCLPGGGSAEGGSASSCISLSCRSNSDCGADLVCETDIGTECIQEADGGQSCGPASACVPQWQAPCTADGDCGDGFQCQSLGSLCDCSGKRSLLDAGGVVTPCESIPMPPHPPCLDDAACPSFPSLCDAGTTCICATTRMCVEQLMPPCSVSTDCLPGWTCACPPAGGVEIPADASLAAGGCESKVCEPPNWDLSYLPDNNGAAIPEPSPPTTVDASLAASTQTGATRATSSGGGCSIGASPAGRAPGSWLWLGLGLTLVAIRSARRRDASGHHAE